MTATTVDAARDDVGTTDGVRALDRLLDAKGLLVAPLGIAAVAYGLFWLVDSKDLSTVEERNLAWSVVRPQILRASDAHQLHDAINTQAENTREEERVCVSACMQRSGERRDKGAGAGLARQRCHAHGEGLDPL